MRYWELDLAVAVTTLALLGVGYWRGWRDHGEDARDRRAEVPTHGEGRTLALVADESTTPERTHG